MVTLLLMRMFQWDLVVVEEGERHREGRIAIVIGVSVVVEEAVEQLETEAEDM